MAYTSYPTQKSTDPQKRDDTASSPLTHEQVTLLEGLCGATGPERSLDDFASDDRIFLTGVGRRLRSRQLDMLMLPEASLRLTDLLRQGDRPVTEYAALVSKDPALSIEVLKAANSALYAGSANTSSVQDAIMRLGLARLQSILMVTVLKARVLKAGRLQGTVDAIIDLALPIGSVASQLARHARKPSDPCFMRGMLLHVEHLVILGMVNDLAREHRVPLTLSTPAILTAFVRYGPEIREAVAKAWHLEGLFFQGDSGDGLDYPALRQAIVSKWLGYSLPTVSGVSPDLLEAVVAPIGLRVAPVVAQETIGGQGVSGADAQDAQRWLTDYLNSAAGAARARRP